MHFSLVSGVCEAFWDHKSLEEMFLLGVPVAEKMIRPIIVYVFLVTVLRVFGKRELTNLNPFDFVVLLTLSNTVQNAIIGNDNSVTGGILGGVHAVADQLPCRSIHLQASAAGSAGGGEPDGPCGGREGQREEILCGEPLTEAELTTVAHRQGFAGLHEIDKCVLEPGGNFYVKGKDPGRMCCDTGNCWSVWRHWPSRSPQ